MMAVRGSKVGKQACTVASLACTTSSCQSLFPHVLSLPAVLARLPGQGLEGGRAQGAVRGAGRAAGSGGMSGGSGWLGCVRRAVRVGSAVCCHGGGWACAAFECLP